MKSRIATSIIVFCAPTAASADTIIDNGVFETRVNYVGGAFGSDVYAQSFIAPEDDTTLVQFGMWLRGGGDQAPAVRIDLWADDGSDRPDENTILVAGTVHQGNLHDLTRIDTFSDIELIPGDRYWVVINGIIDQQSLGFYGSVWDAGADTIPDGFATWSNDRGEGWNEPRGGDFAVYVRMVPPPGSIILLCLGGLTATRRRR